MRLIDADELVRTVNTQASFQCKKSWTVNELKELIRRQPNVPEHSLRSWCERVGVKLQKGMY